MASAIKIMSYRLLLIHCKNNTSPSTDKRQSSSDTQQSILGLYHSLASLRNVVRFGIYLFSSFNIAAEASVLPLR